MGRRRSPLPDMREDERRAPSKRHGHRVSTAPKPLDLVGALYMDKALCRPGVAPEGVTWFPVRGDINAARAAKAVCMGCPVRQRCLDYAIAHNERHGVWGGTTPDERRVIRRSAGLVKVIDTACPSHAAIRRHDLAGEPRCDECLAFRRAKDAERKARNRRRAA